MCNVAISEFFINEAKPEEFKDKRVLEVGSKSIALTKFDFRLTPIKSLKTAHKTSQEP